MVVLIITDGLPALWCKSLLCANANRCIGPGRFCGLVEVEVGLSDGSLNQ
jgi:hypothetical protein